MLIGLERQLSHRDQRHSQGGIRTFALVAVLGMMSGMIGSALSPWIPVVSLFGLCLFLALSHSSLMPAGRKGITTEIALFITFLLGLLVHLDQTVFAVAVALFVSFIMSIKLTIESIVKQITEEELFAIFKFLVVSVLVLPLLPDTTIDPYNVINPQDIWTVVVLVLTLSFVGYALIKFWGPAKGIMLTGFLGGLVSSTVVTWVFSKRSAIDEKNSRIYALATLLAVSIMSARIYVLSQIVNGKIGAHLILPLSCIFLTGLVTVYVIKKYFGLGTDGASQAVTLGNPFNLGDAIKFGVAFSTIIWLVAFSNKNFGNAGVYAVSALSGLANVDAIAVSMARLGGAQVALNTALNAIIIATLSNNVVKLAISLIQGSRTYKLTMSLGIGLMFISIGIWSALFSW